MNYDKIVVLDIGAAELDDVPPYQRLPNDIIDVYKFDGDPEAKGSHDLVWLGDGNDTFVRYCSPESGMTSLFAPNKATLKLFKDFERFGDVKKIDFVKTTKLDDVDHVPPVDFLVMDTQGSELAIMQHGTTKLRDAVVIQLEVSFVPLYKGQPTFGAVDTYMRGMGFIPHTFVYVKPWEINSKQKGQFTNQLLEADVVYIKDPRANNWTERQRLACATILAACYGSDDMAGYILEHADE